MIEIFMKSGLGKELMKKEVQGEREITSENFFNHTYLLHKCVQKAQICRFFGR